MRSFLLFFAVFLMISCEKSEITENDFAGTWTLDWQHCEGFYNAAFGTMVLNITDSTENHGIMSELKSDTIHTFDFRFGFNGEEEFWIDSIYDGNDSSLWLGTHQLEEVQGGSFLLTRPVKACEGEQFKFVK